MELETILSVIGLLFVFAVGYGQLKEKIKTLEKFKDHTEEKMDGIHDINVTLEGMKKDIHYIKLKLDKEEQ